MITDNARTWIARVCIALVLIFNLQAALLFITRPEQYAPGFALEGAPGAGMVRGMGILFLMWNVPYLVAVTDPVRRRVSLFEAVAMQAIGVIGETLLLLAFPDGYPAIQASVGRFIIFDGFGLAALLAAVLLTVSLRRN